MIPAASVHERWPLSFQRVGERAITLHAPSSSGPPTNPAPERVHGHRTRGSAADRSAEIQRHHRGHRRWSVGRGQGEPTPCPRRRVRSAVGSASAAGSARLVEVIRTAATDPAAAHLMAASPLPQGAQSLSGVVYSIRQNPLGLETMRLDVHPDQTTVSLGFRDGRRERHDIGMDGVYRISEGGYLGLPVAVRGRWESDDVFVLETTRWPTSTRTSCV